MTLTLALAQFNPTVGDIEGNAARIRALHVDAVRNGVDMLVLPELALTGYSPEDLLLRPAFQGAAQDALLQLARDCAAGPAIVLGGVWGEMEGIFNAAFLLEDGELKHIQRKSVLPNNGVFDERRTFQTGSLPQGMTWRGHRIGLLICEEMWHADAAKSILAQGAVDFWLVLNASPFEATKHARRLSHARDIVALADAPLIYLNTIGGQDELVFDGASFALNADGIVAVQLLAFEECVSVIEVGGETPRRITGEKRAQLDTPEALWNAACLGLRDYVEKSGFSGVLLGLSGGIDSAIVAAIATDALGADKVHPVLLPSPYTSEESLHQARETAANLGLTLREIPIAPGMNALDAMLAESFADTKADVTEENIQSRLRGLTLMALSNKFGFMLMTTGNKSEIAVGYATIYGDMCGGYNPIKDLYKTEIYALAKWRNTQKGGVVIPEITITRAPTAELRPNQTDQDSLPPYDVLDAILRLLIEERQPISAIIALGYEEMTVQRVARLLRGAEYKRRQSAPGPKLSTTAFGRDWRMPLVDRFIG